jgi:membrane dipeptidase
VRAAHKAGKFAALMMEGGHMIDDSPLSCATTSARRPLPDARTASTPTERLSGDTPKHNGLTDFGKDVVRELNRLGAARGHSHVSDKTFGTRWR